MTVNSTAGSKLYIGGSTAVADTTTAYAALTWVEVKEIQSFGEFGDKAEEIKFTAVGDARVRKMKGARDAGDMQIEVGRDALDPGQIAMRAAAASNAPYNFKVVLNDMGATSATTFYFGALVNSASNQLKGVNDVTLQSFSLAITTDILEAPAV